MYLKTATVHRTQAASTEEHAANSQSLQKPDQAELPEPTWQTNEQVQELIERITLRGEAQQQVVVLSVEPG